jgi:hypothetical protein
LDNKKPLINPANTSNGYAVIVSPDDDDDGEQYELLDKAHSDFLQHFENEIRISPLCVDERCSSNSLDGTGSALMAGDRLSGISDSWKSPSLDNTTGKATHVRKGSNEGSILRPCDSAANAPTQFNAVDFLANDFVVVGQNVSPHAALGNILSSR